MNLASIYIGSGAMLAQSQKMGVIGDNIANSNTVAFKSNNINFAEAMVLHSAQQSNGRQGQVGTGVRTTGTSSDWTGGFINENGSMSNLSIVGDGFLPVQVGADTLYTRAGDFTLTETTAGSGQFILMRPDGSVLMGGSAAGADVTLAGPVTFTGLPTSFAIRPDGTVAAQDATVTNGAVGIQRFGNPDALQRLSNGLYKTTTAASPASANPAVAGQNGTGELLQGSLEKSNVDLVREFSELIVTQRAFQANSRTISTSDEMLQEVLNIKR